MSFFRYFLAGFLVVCAFIFYNPADVESSSVDRASRSYYHYVLGLLQDQEQQYEQANSAYKEALRADSQSWNIHFRLAVNYLRDGEFRQAGRELKSILRLRPFDENARYLLALTYSSLLEYKKAIREYNILLQRPLLELDEQEIRYILLQLYITTNSLGQALEQCNIILENDEDDSLAHFYLGYIYSEQDRIDDAIESFITAIEKNPNNSLALNSLSYLYAEQGINLDDAKKLVKRALELDPSNGAYLDTLGWVFFKKGNIDEALRYLNNASVLMQDAEIFGHLGEAYYEKGDFENARKNWLRALELDRKRNPVRRKLRNLNREIRQKRRESHGADEKN